MISTERSLFPRHLWLPAVGLKRIYAWREEWVHAAKPGITYHSDPSRFDSENVLSSPPPSKNSGEFFAEATYCYLSDVARSQLGNATYRPYLPFVGTLFLFVLSSNWLGSLLPWKLIQLPEGEIAAPTNDINVTVALALLVSCTYFGAGIGKYRLAFFYRYISPSPVFLPINLLEDVAKPLSLSFRLFGNVLAEEIVVSVLCLLVPVFVPLPVMALGVFSSAVQALVFSTLAAAYVFESLE
jgi:F-type H+-transporting ATPase subunit a